MNSDLQDFIKFLKHLAHADSLEDLPESVRSEFARIVQRYANVITSDVLKVVVDVRALAPAPKTPDEAPPLPEIWRSIETKERAAAFFKRVYGPLPLKERPFADQVRFFDHDFYNAMAAHMANNRRFNRPRKGEIIDYARSFREIFPVRDRRLTREARANALMRGNLGNDPAP